MKFLNFNYKGQAMLLTVLMLSGIILVASTIAGYLMVLKIRTSSDIANSAKAIFAADAGIEWELYKFFRKDINYPKPSFTNDVELETSINDNKIRSIGKANNSYRAFEVEISEGESRP